MSDFIKSVRKEKYNQFDFKSKSIDERIEFLEQIVEFKVKMVCENKRFDSIEAIKEVNDKLKYVFYIQDQLDSIKFSHEKHPVEASMFSSYRLGKLEEEIFS